MKEDWQEELRPQCNPEEVSAQSSLLEEPWVRQGFGSRPLLGTVIAWGKPEECGLRESAAALGHKGAAAGGCQRTPLLAAGSLEGRSEQCSPMAACHS